MRRVGQEAHSSEVEVLLVGENGSGKTTLLNALLLATMEILPTTAAVSRLLVFMTFCVELSYLIVNYNITLSCMPFAR